MRYVEIRELRQATATDDAKHGNLLQIQIYALRRVKMRAAFCVPSPGVITCKSTSICTLTYPSVSQLFRFALALRSNFPAPFTVPPYVPRPKKHRHYRPR